MPPSIHWEEITKLISNKLHLLGFNLVKAFPAQRSRSINNLIYYKFKQLFNLIILVLFFIGIMKIC